MDAPLNLRMLGVSVIRHIGIRHSADSCELMHRALRM